MHISVWPLAVYSTGHILYNDYNHQYFYVDEWEVELGRVTGKALTMSQHTVYLIEGGYTEIFSGIPFILIGWFPPIDITFSNSNEYTRSYLTVRLVWYTPSAVKCEKGSVFFNIFSVYMWMFFVLSLVFAVITVSCISS